MRPTFPRFAAALVLAALARAQEPTSRPVEVYTKVTLAELEDSTGEWPDGNQWGWMPPEHQPLSGVLLGSGAEGFFAPAESAEAPDAAGRAPGRAGTALVLRSVDAADVAGMLVFAETFRSDTPASAVRFKIPKARLGNATRKDFFEAGRARFTALAGAGLPGGAWFRWRLAAIEAELGGAAKPVENPRRLVLGGIRDRGGDADDAYDFFSAGRAVSENLRLDRSLVPIEGGEPTIPIATVEGIDTKAFDWNAAIAKLSPKKDPLASLIPEDQHAAFFGSLAEIDHTVSALETQAAPILAEAIGRPEDSDLRALYEGQLGFKLKAVAYDPLISAFVKSVAVTGSDPYFATGTDLAVLIEAAEPAVAYGALSLRQKASAAARPDSKLESGEVDGNPYSWLRTEDRLLSSIVARVGPAIVVTNSLAQLRRIVDASKGTVPRLSDSPEYVFFRDRYAIGYVVETAFVLLTDATIRRWCGPKWRIGDARRTRAAAQLAHLTMLESAALVRGQIKPGPFTGADAPAGLGPLSWTQDGLLSATWGTLRFLTPILETDVSMVTGAEATAYRQFKASYQQRWSQYFDPIAIRFGTGGGGASSLALDVTVMPLVESSDYRELMQLARSARFSATACDPHDGALAQLTIAIDAAAAAMEDWEKGARRMRGSNVESLALSWLKGGISIALDKDPVLDDIKPGRDSEVFRKLPRLPLLLTAEVKDPVSLALLLTGVRASIEDSGLGSVQWTKGKRGDVETMTLSGIPGIVSEDSMSLRYAIVDGLLMVALREDVLNRSIDRAADRRAGKQTGQPWLGESAAVRVEKSFVEFLFAADGPSWEREQRELAWRALPILSEYHRLWPDQDPVLVHEKLTKVKLVDPAGGRYVVDKDGLRIVSETYGHPTEPRPGPKLPKLLERFKEARAGLTFENDGVRARFVLEREK